MSAHRYWRFWFPTVGYAGVCAITELEMRTTAGGANVAVGGSGVASSYNALHPPSDAFDGSTLANNGWLSDASSEPQWLQYDFGAGNEKDIVEIVVKSAASGSGELNSLSYFPVQFLVQFSDDYTHWTTQRAIGRLSWAWGDSKTLDVAAVTENNRVYHKFNIYKYNAAALSGAPTAHHLYKKFNIYKYNAAALSGAPTSDAKKWHGLCRQANVGNPFRVTEFSGNYHVAGITTNLALSVSRRVCLIDQQSGRLVDSIQTSANGQFDFRDVANRVWTVIGVDDTGTQNSVVFSHITPELQ